jgi:catechol 2,3-dioxygenase-like lactoylglutathione lyase family enzyme
MDLKVEAVVIPVSDADKAKHFYGSVLGWREDADFSFGDGSRIVQMTPPGSACSIHFGAGVALATAASPASLLVAVDDVETARSELVARGVEVTDVFHAGDGVFYQRSQWLPGPNPDRRTYSSFAAFEDPDGNQWLLQEITVRLPGRVTGPTTYSSASGLAGALRRAAAGHGEHEGRTGQPDADWPDWYAEYMVREQAGDELPA